MADLLIAVPFAVVSSIVTWVAQAYVYRDKHKLQVAGQSDKLEIHRDEFTLELLKSARSEITMVRGEINELREERSTLFKLEQHVYYFQESLDHLERLLFADTPEDLQQARRNAGAFLRRMKRLQEAKGTILNEVQLRESQEHLGVPPIDAAPTIKPVKGHDDAV